VQHERRVHSWYNIPTIGPCQGSTVFSCTDFPTFVIIFVTHKIATPPTGFDL
jgi:hypothetical protein